MPDEELDRHLETSECPDDFTRMYPKVCVADFGLVFDTRTDVLLNPPPGAGTLGYRPPEQIGFGVGHNSRRFARPPNPERYKHTTAHNVWGIGKVLFDAMTGFGFKVIQNALDNLEEAKYEERGGHFLSRRWVDEYTDVELANLVHQCLSPQAAQRPSLDDILNQTSAKIKELQHHLENAGTETMRKARLYFREKELNYLVPGPRLADFECNDYTYLQVRFRNPEVPVDLPEAIWGDWLRENSGRLAQLYPGEHRKVTGKGQVSLGDHGEVIPADNDGLVDPIRTGANRDIPDKLPVFQQPPRPRTVDRQSVPQPPPNQNMVQPPMVHQGQVPPQPVPQAQTDQQRRYQQGIDGIDNYPVAHMLAQPHLQNVQPWGGGNAEPGSSRDVAPIINSETGSAHQPFVGNVQPRGNGNVGRLASNDVGPDLTALGRNFNFSSRPPSRRQRSRRPSPQMKIEHQSEQRPRLSQMVGVTRQRMRSPPPPSTIADDDAALKLYEEADMKGLRAECKHRKLSVKLAGKGITKKFLAKALVRADRAGNTGRGVPKKKKKKLQGSKGRRKR
ncbi:uncharacterized protein HMPREF1541_08632 [Cyphellophora europaea CBS 101466]|uniref:Protein kinase domain-containing protein n=1 Tax=Cyphellophora europaea (strain CBS 101466) TaxID=1220924 RepID=W2RJ45_CYPE1|nr:uncharacterized protein HMPREF1541_08632 [Cyphellophora europaea CBS 101466]ETN36355.1 hypothetical protein HMPREF1541_08632 [Cyphellophora europaea CBS 101466]